MWLIRRFVLRQFTREPGRPIGTVLGVALGVAVVVAIRLANQSSVRGFEEALHVMAGRTSLEVTGDAGSVDEARLAQLGWVHEYGAVSVVVEGDAVFEAPDGRRELLRILGVDVLRDLPFREYDVLQLSGRDDAPSSRDILDLLLAPDAAIFTERFAGRYGLGAGRAVSVVFGDTARSVRIAGLLRDRGPARALEGNLLLMDIAAAQWALGRLGTVDRLDLLLADEADVEVVRQEIAARLPAGLSVQRPERRGAQAGRMLAAFHLNLTALSLVALLVGVFLVYNTVSVSVVGRREEIGTLRALGARRETVLACFLVEAAVLGVVGSSLGVLAGRLLAAGAVWLTSTTVNVLYVAAAAASPALGVADVLIALTAGTVLAVVAAAAPAIEASRVEPVAAMRGADRLTAARRPAWRTMGVSMTLLAAGGWLASLDPIGGVPVFGFAAAFALVFAAAFLVPSTLYFVGRVGRAPLESMFRVEGVLAHDNLSGAVPRLSVSVAALAVSVSMMVAIAIMVGSFRDTVIHWVEQTLEADLYIGPGARAAGARQATLSPDVEAVVRAHPSVAAVAAVHSTTLPVGGLPVLVNATDLDLLRTRGRLLLKEAAADADPLRSAAGRDAVVVSEVLANRQGLRAGGAVTLPTPAGPVPFRVTGVFHDYSSDRGVVQMDCRTFARHFGARPPTGLGVYLQPGVDPDAARTAITGELPPGRELHIYTNARLRAEVLRIFDATFVITYALELVAIVVAILGVTGTLVTLALERRREFAVLRLIGADERQVRRMIVLEALMMGLVSQTIGIGVGVLLSLLLIHVINVQSFGWTIRLAIPVALLAQMHLVVLAATAAAGLVPAHRVSRLSIAGGVSEE